MSLLTRYLASSMVLIGENRTLIPIVFVIASMDYARRRPTRSIHEFEDWCKGTQELLRMNCVDLGRQLLNAIIQFAMGIFR